MASIGPIITIIGSILLVLFKAWQDGAPARTKETRDEDTQKGRADIAAGDSSAVSARVDKLLPEQATTAAGTPSGELDPGRLLQQFAREEGAQILPDRT